MSSTIEMSEDLKKIVTLINLTRDQIKRTKFVNINHKENTLDRVNSAILYLGYEAVEENELKKKAKL